MHIRLSSTLPLLILLMLSRRTASQPFAGTDWHREDRIDIPFSFEQNLVLVEVVLDHFLPLRFILDTGAEHTILAKRQLTDMLGASYEREFRIMGADMQTELLAYLVRNVDLTLRGGNAFREKTMELPNHPMLVLAEDYLRLDEITGIEIHGILGADVFRHLAVQFNFEKKVVSLLRRTEAFSPPKRFRQVPLEVKRNKPYLETFLSLQGDTAVPVRLLLDSGAMLSLLLDTETHPSLALPPHLLTGHIGAGLGGYLSGYLGKIHALQWGQDTLRSLPTNFQTVPDQPVTMDSSLRFSRHGIVGNAILQRFHLIIDYPGQTLHYLPNRRFRKQTPYDKSGLVIIATDLNLHTFSLHAVIPGSPAALAGLQPGDELLRLNGISTSLRSLSNIQHRLSGRHGRKIRLTVRRNGQRLDFRFRLQALP
ncbi:MAG: hypothetical protein RLY31_1656 [Bacteroidota bacterium]